MEMKNIEYSVIIPTNGRDEIVRAIESVINQTLPPSEIIVIGHNISKDIDLFKGNNLLRIIRTDIKQTSSKNRADGTALVQSPFICFLDDDDYWLNGKMEKQTELIDNDNDKIIISCRSFIHSPFGEFVWPRKLIGHDESISEYLFGKISIIPGERYFQTSGLFMKTKVARLIGWSESDHDDLDFLLSAHRIGVRFKMHPFALVVVDQTTDGLSRQKREYVDSIFLQRHGTYLKRNELQNFLVGIQLQRVMNTTKKKQIWRIFIQILRLGVFTKASLIAILRVLRLRELLRRL
jgi:glycosyltransferase involved in cell wall biosynthesis